MDASSSSTSSSYKRPRKVRYDEPITEPQLSPHWQSLEHLPDDKLVRDVKELQAAFQWDLDPTKPANNNNNTAIAVWSTVCGYCEALTTHKDPLKRYRIYPIPIDALRRLVTREFLPFCQQLETELVTNNSDTTTSSIATTTTKHREAVRFVSNAVWKRAQGKSKNVRDELHANSLYVCFRGSIDKRSLDCFGAAVVTIAALHQVLKQHSSFLTLSEDHAYESHHVNTKENNNNNNTSSFGTCEIAIPGNTKDVKQTRGLEVADALAKANKNKKLSYTVTPETSWLYMRKHPVICCTIPMTIAAVVGNINCNIVEANNGNSSSSCTVMSGPLMDMKRELLWILHDSGHLDQFPFALIELGECEEHRTTKRGLEWMDVSDMGIRDKVMGVEKLYLNAMSIARSYYGDGQAYPYFCAGHYHKDAVWEEPTTNNDNNSNDNDSSLCCFNLEQEYRLVEAVRLYSEASRVASQYYYDMQLMKHMTKAAMLIMHDIMTQQQQPRTWCNPQNAIAIGTWVIAFYDSLLLWEERCGGKQFCEILSPHHKYSMEKMFQLLTVDIRRQLIEKLFSSSSSDTKTGDDLPMTAITQNKLHYFSNPRSKRLQKDSAMISALAKEKLVIREMELAIPMSTEGGRRAKRARNNR